MELFSALMNSTRNIDAQLINSHPVRFLAGGQPQWMVELGEGPKINISSFLLNWGFSDTQWKH